MPEPRDRPAIVVVERGRSDAEYWLKQRGVVTGIAETPVQVRSPEDNGLQTERGPYLSSDLPIAGFSIMEAKDIDEAIELASKSPCAVAHGVIEIWPLKEH